VPSGRSLCRTLQTVFREGNSMLRNSSGSLVPAIQQPNTPFSRRFGLVFGPTWRADRADDRFFNILGIYRQSGE
jgi:hypothetical protein